MSDVAAVFDVLASITQFVLGALVLYHAFRITRDRDPSPERHDLIVILCSLSVLLFAAGGS